MSEAEGRRIGEPLPSAASCKDLLRKSTGGDRQALLFHMQADPRTSVRAIALAELRRDAADAAEDLRQTSLMTDQLRLHADGLRVIAGVDEVGRGALAGPLTVAAVVLSAECRIRGLDDSKRLSPARRGSIAQAIREVAIGVSVIHIPAEEIDLVGIGNAVRLGMGRAVAGLPAAVDHVLVDGNDARIGYPACAVVRGDSKCACIAAASVVAKVERDALMVEHGRSHPEYGFGVNKGYGTAEHIEAIMSLGVTDLHRRSFSPCGDRPLF